MNDEAIMKVEDLKVWFPVHNGLFKRVNSYVKAVNEVSFDVYEGETLGIVGESGCGKTTLGKALMLLEKPTSGHIFCKINDKYCDIQNFTSIEKFHFRKFIQMVFQDPYSALNPRKKILEALEEPLITHGMVDPEKRADTIAKALDLVNLPQSYLFKYPHEFSGGQRQRICIARALEINPKILVCDEAVSALDVSIQAQVLNLMKDIQKEQHLTYIFIAHDLSVVQYMSDRIAVMYLGKIVELANAYELYRNPMHPYTASLLSAVPVPKLNQKKERVILKGDVPSPIDRPSGCPFHERCNKCTDICKKIEPVLKTSSDKNHYIACHLY